MADVKWSSVLLGFVISVLFLGALAVVYGLVTVYWFGWYYPATWYSVAFVAAYIQFTILLTIGGVGVLIKSVVAN